MRCPGCQTIFSPAANAAPRPAPPPPPQPAPEFEVVDDEPPRSRGRDRDRDRDRDDDEDDRPRKKRRRDDDEDDRDRPRSRSRSRDDDSDDDDRPRKRSRRDDDYDDDRDRDRPNRRRKRRDDYDDEPTPPDKKAPYRRAKVGALLVMISLWIYLGSLGLMALFVLLLWAGASFGEGGLFILPGLAGLANWLVAGVGLGLIISGPQKSRGLAIAAASLAGVHLILTIVSLSQMERWMFLSSVGWITCVSQLPFVDMVLPFLIYSKTTGGLSGEFTIVVLAGVCEIARLILVMLTLRSLAEAARDTDAGGKCQSAVMIASAVMGGAAILVLLAIVIVVESKMTTGARHLMGATMTLVYLGYALMLVPAAMAAMDTKDAVDRRT